VTIAWQLYADKPDMVFAVAVDIDVGGRRLPAGYDVVASKKVAIVGCGSAGSKIAVSLARSGVTGFVLVDDDLFLRDNFVRHDLDWRSVGEHKADGVARRIRYIAPNADIVIRRVKLRIRGDRRERPRPDRGLRSHRRRDGGSTGLQPAGLGLRHV
jgi:hypothetical protein